MAGQHTCINGCECRVHHRKAVPNRSSATVNNTTRLFLDSSCHNCPRVAIRGLWIGINRACNNWAYMAQTSNFLIKCACGCGQELTERDNQGRPRRFLPYHCQASKKGSLNSNWKGGRFVVGRTGYVKILKHGHPRANAMGQVFEHIIAYEEHYKCCVLRWGHIHHK